MTTAAAEPERARPTASSSASSEQCAPATLGWPGASAARRGHLDQRQSIIERGIGLARIVDDLDRPVPHRRDRSPVADRDEWRQPELGAIVPAFGDDFRADSGGIAERNRERGRVGACHGRRP